MKEIKLRASYIAYAHGNFVPDTPWRVPLHQFAAPVAAYSGWVNCPKCNNPLSIDKTRLMEKASRIYTEYPNEKDVGYCLYDEKCDFHKVVILVLEH